MTSGSKKRKGSADLAPLLRDALKAQRLRLPETTEDVAAAEDEVVSETAELPARLRDPMGFLEAPGTLRLRTPARQGLQDDDVEQDLARAAREGGAITKDVEKRMREDRSAAEAAEPDDKE